MRCLVPIGLKYLNFQEFGCYASGMAMASVTLAYQGTSYTFNEDDQTVLKGRLACDCEKSRLIRDACDSEFPLLKCGAEIIVVSVSDAGERKTAGRQGEVPRSRNATTGR